MPPTPRPAAARAQRSQPARVPRVSSVVPPDQQGQHFQQGRARGPQRQSGGFPGREARQNYREARGTLGEVSSVTPKLAAEWLVCVLIIGATTLTKPGDYLGKMSETLWRLTAVSGLFFVLALVSMYRKAGDATVAFGALIVVGVLFKSSQEIKTVLDMAAGQGSGEDKAKLTADLDSSEPTVHNILQ